MLRILYKNFNEATMIPILTIIIPFRNEGKEVYNTVKSLVEQAGQEVYLILINDASDDKYDYKSIADSFNGEYFEHSYSWGVAASREHGISLCKTDFFMFFDAHMRAFTPNWATIVLNELQKERQSVFCCATIAITLADMKKTSNIKGFGVTLDLMDLTYRWNEIDPFPDSTTCNIPCIMGASYACNISYWKKLRGLEGLRGYGFDEQFISIKVALEGGCCKIIKNVIFGHIFRVFKDVPYVINLKDVIFNQLYLMELLYPINLKATIFHNVRRLSDIEHFTQAIEEIEKIRVQIAFLKQYYKNIFTRDFDYVLDINYNKIDL